MQHRNAISVQAMLSKLARKLEQATEFYSSGRDFRTRVGEAQKVVIFAQISLDSAYFAESNKKTNTTNYTKFAESSLDYANHTKITHILFSQIYTIRKAA